MDCLCSQITPRDGVSSCPCVSSHQKSLDRFVVAHLLGWWGKTLMIRDPYVCHVVSFLFEILPSPSDGRPPRLATIFPPQGVNMEMAVVRAGPNAQSTVVELANIVGRRSNSGTRRHGGAHYTRGPPAQQHC